jgi:hypothetical protein
MPDYLYPTQEPLAKGRADLPAYRPRFLPAVGDDFEPPRTKRIWVSREVNRTIPRLPFYIALTMEEVGKAAYVSLNAVCPNAYQPAALAMALHDGYREDRGAAFTGKSFVRLLDEDVKRYVLGGLASEDYGAVLWQGGPLPLNRKSRLLADALREARLAWALPRLYLVRNQTRFPAGPDGFYYLRGGVPEEEADFDAAPFETARQTAARFL